QGLEGRGAPYADKLAEDLRDLRRGDEIAVRSDRVARHVIAIERMAEAKSHVAVERHRPVLADYRDDEALEWRRLLHVWRDRRSRPMPIATVGGHTHKAHVVHTH